MDSDISSSSKKSSRNTKTNRSNLVKPAIGVVALLVVAGFSFYGGVTFQKGQKTTTATTASTQLGGQGGFGRGGGRFGANRVVGSVTAISSTSITVQNSRTGTPDTLSITSATQISDNGATASASDIQNGDTVFITENSSNTSQAASILVNPSFGGGAAPQSDTTTPPPTATVN